MACQEVSLHLVSYLWSRLFFKYRLEAQALLGHTKAKLDTMEARRSLESTGTRVLQFRAYRPFLGRDYLKAHNTQPSNFPLNDKFKQ